MKNSKRFLTLLLALVMLVGVFTFSALAQEATTIEVRLEGEGSNANFSPDSDGKLTLPAYNNCIGWTCGGRTFNVGDEIGYAEAASVATNGVAVFTPVYEEDNSVPSIPLRPSIPTNPNKPGNDKPGNDKPGNGKPGNDKPGNGKPGNDKPGHDKPGYDSCVKYDLSIEYYVEDYYYGYDCDYGCKKDCKHTVHNGKSFGWYDTPWFDSSWDRDPRACNNHYNYQSTCYFCTNGSNSCSKPSYSCGTSNTSVKLRGEGSYTAGQRITVSASKSFTYRGVKYTFAGWYGYGSFGNRNSASTTYTMPCADTTIYAVYSANSCYDRCTSNHTHTVVYTDGVSGQTIFTDVVKSVRHGATTPTIKNPTRSGYRFVGWTPKVAKTTTECVVYEAMWSKGTAPKLTTECVPYLNGYDENTFGPTDNMTRSHFAALLYRLLDDATVKAYKTSDNDFSDVSTQNWYNDAVSTLANAGVIEATKEFRPYDEITRAEMVSWLAAFYADSYNGKSTSSYKDVPTTYWAYEAISFADAQGWVEGYGANTFLPDATITRAEVAAIINRVLDRDCDVKDTKDFDDVSKTAWYYADVMEATVAH